MRKLIWLVLTVLPAPAQNAVVATENGALRGTLSGGAWSYRKIPYAAPPVGELRWAPPQPAESWQGERDATVWGPLCPQLDQDAAVGEEDCLHLNVWTPARLLENPAPVMFWIHGGGHVQGGAPIMQGDTRIYDGARLAERSGAVVVTINYRLGPLGYLALPELSGSHGSSGNLGTLDQIAALGWVQRNISAFGGDPSRVMIMGESAGAVSVCALLASPKAAGLFHAAVMQSGGCTARRLEEAEAFGRKFARQAGCVEDTAACLRRLTPEQLLHVLPIEVNVAADTGDYGSVIDGEVQPEAPMAAIRAGRHHPVPAIVGANADETSRSVPPILNEAQYAAIVTGQFGPLAPLVLRQYPAEDYDSPRSAYVALTTDARFVCTSRRTARALAENQSQPVFRYFFSFVPENASPALRQAGTWHGLDIFYLFETLDGVGGYPSGARDEEVAHVFQDYWSQLAAAGDPNRAGLPSWPRYTEDDPYLELNAPPRSGTGLRAGACDFWDRLSDLLAPRAR